MARGGQTPRAAGSPRLSAAWALFEAGDKVAARRAARALLAAGPGPDERAEALELLRRCATPLPVYAVALAVVATFLLLLVLAALRY
jgi:hypothetical protein